MIILFVFDCFCQKKHWRDGSGGVIFSIFTKIKSYHRGHFSSRNRWWFFDWICISCFLPVSTLSAISQYDLFITDVFFLCAPPIILSTAGRPYCDKKPLVLASYHHQNKFMARMLGAQYSDCVSCSCEWAAPQLICSKSVEPATISKFTGSALQSHSEYHVIAIAFKYVMNEMNSDLHSEKQNGETENYAIHSLSVTIYENKTVNTHHTHHCVLLV